MEEDFGGEDFGEDVGGEVEESPVSQTNDWHSSLREDLRASNALKKFKGDSEGLNGLLNSYNHLEKLLSHDKVPLPKDFSNPDDPAWGLVKKAFGIPEDPSGYTFKPTEGVNLDEFATMAHELDLMPGQAEALLTVFGKLFENGQVAQQQSQKQAQINEEVRLTETINQLKSEWGDEYDLNVERGQALINKFSDDEGMNDFITSVLCNDARGVKFLAKIGSQFSENKIGNSFQPDKFGVGNDTSEDINKLTSDMNSPYWNRNEKYTKKEHEEAVEKVNRLRAMALRREE